MSTGRIVSIVVVLIGWGVSAYNNLVTLKNRVKNGWAQIDVQLKQRADLIPNLVNAVKGAGVTGSHIQTYWFEYVRKAYPQIQNPDWLDGNATDSLVYWNFWHGSIGALMMTRRGRVLAMALALVLVSVRQAPTIWVPALAASSISVRS